MFKCCRCLLAPFQDSYWKGLTMYTNIFMYTLAAGLCACLPPSQPKMCIPSSADPSVRGVGAAALPDGTFTCDTTLGTKTFRHTVSLFPTHLSYSICWVLSFLNQPMTLPLLITYSKSLHDMSKCSCFSRVSPCKHALTDSPSFFISPLSRLLSCDSWEEVNKAFDMLRSSCWSMHSHYLFSLPLLISCFLTFMLYL